MIQEVRLDVKVKDPRARRVFSPDTSVVNNLDGRFGDDDDGDVSKGGESVGGDVIMVDGGGGGVGLICDDDINKGGEVDVCKKIDGGDADVSKGGEVGDSDVMQVVDLLDVAKKIKKTPILVCSSTGLVVDRLYIMYSQATMFLAQQGEEKYHLEQMAVAAQNTNNTTIKLILMAEKLTGSNFTNWYCNLRIVLRYEKKMKFVEQPIGPAPDPETADPNTIDKFYEFVNFEQEVACLTLSNMSPDLQRTLEKYNAYDMMKELKTMFEEQAKQELFETVKAFHACKQEDDQSFIQNYNMHSMGKTLSELHAMLKLHEKGILRKAETSAVLAIHEGKIQKDKKKFQLAKGKAKGKNKLSYAPKTKIPPSPKRDNLAKDSICHHCKEVGHWRRNCPSYHAELKKRKN
ncbi:zinc finger, CCHC-type containing protein, partial [Tanacetum coccineum]